MNRTGHKGLRTTTNMRPNTKNNDNKQKCQYLNDTQML